MRWRPLLVALHRDIGYLCAGLVVAYAVSGIAVNHRQHWDYNFKTSSARRSIGSPAQLLGPAAQGSPGELARQQQEALVAALTAKLGRPAPPVNVFWRGPDRLSLFFAAGGRDVVDYFPSRGAVEEIRVADRFLLRELNFLHLNEGRRFWPWLADLFCVALIFLAVSGAIVVKGRRGLRGRGAVFLALGVALPVVAYLLLR